MELPASTSPMEVENGELVPINRDNVLRELVDSQGALFEEQTEDVELIVVSRDDELREPVDYLGAFLEVEAESALNPTTDEEGDSSSSSEDDVNLPNSVINPINDDTWDVSSLMYTPNKRVSLHHQGVFFPDNHEPLDAPLLYNGQEFNLPADIEEYLALYAKLIGEPCTLSDWFNQNFFNSLIEYIEDTGRAFPFEEFKYCDFSLIRRRVLERETLQDNMSLLEIQELQRQNLSMERRFGYATVDGRSEKLINFRINLPCIFSPTRYHPNAGSIIRRVRPEDITINIGEEAEVPLPPIGHEWKKVIHKPNILFTASYKCSVTEKYVYTTFSHKSIIRGRLDKLKYEKARELSKHIDQLRFKYEAELAHEDIDKRQQATAISFFYMLSLRPGKKDKNKERKSAGCFSLRCSHIETEEPDKVTLNFEDKKNHSFSKTFTASDQLFNNIVMFKSPPKGNDDYLFDKLKVSEITRFLKGQMIGLTPKVFRTYNASTIFQNELLKTPPNASIPEKLYCYNSANLEVAKHLNHLQNNSITDHQLETINNKIIKFKYKRQQTKQYILHLNPALEEVRPELLEPEEGLSKELCINYLKNHYDQKREAKKTAFYKENYILQRARNNQIPAHQTALINSLNSKEQSLIDEVQTGIIQNIPNSYTVIKLNKKLSDLKLKLERAIFCKEFKEHSRGYCLNTSKCYYLDPRLTFLWCKTFEVPINSVFDSFLCEKFNWASQVDDSFRYQYLPEPVDS